MDNKKFIYIPQLTAEEIAALSNYKGIMSTVYNCILNDGIEAEETYSMDSANPFTISGINNPQYAINSLCNLYSAIYKMSKQRDSQGTKTFYRGTSIEDVNVMQKSNTLKKFLSTSKEYRIAEGRFALPWKHPAILTVEVANDAPFFSYTSVVGMSSDPEHSNGISDLDEKEVIIAPFCKVETVPRDKSFWGGYSSKDDPAKYDVKISKGQLKELSPEEEQEGLKYLEENSERCSKLMESILGNTYAKEYESIQHRINMLMNAYSEVRAEQKVKYSEFNESCLRSYNEEIKEKRARLQELSDERELAIKEVTEFKKYIRPICMSRCKAIEREIDKDYENQKSEFIRRQNDTELQSRIKRREELVNRGKVAVGEPTSFFEKFMRDEGMRPRNKADVEIGRLNEIKNQQVQLDELSADLGIQYYRYLTNVDDLKLSCEELSDSFNEMRHELSALEYSNIDKLSNNQLDEIERAIGGVERNLASYSMLARQFRVRQDNAFLSAIHNKLLLKKSNKHKDDLVKELTEITNRSTLDRVKDFFKGNGSVKKQRAEEIKRALPLISKKETELAEIMKKPILGRNVNPQAVYNELKQIKDQLEEKEYRQIKSYIISNFSVEDEEQSFEESIALFDDGKKMSEKEKMDIFLNSNGYENDEQFSKPNVIQNMYSVDELSQTAIDFIQKNKRAIESAEHFKDVLKINDEHKKQNETQKNEIKGLGEGFNIVR